MSTTQSYCSCCWGKVENRRNFAWKNLEKLKVAHSTNSSSFQRWVKRHWSLFWSVFCVAVCGCFSARGISSFQRKCYFSATALEDVCVARNCCDKSKAEQAEEAATSAQLLDVIFQSAQLLRKFSDSRATVRDQLCLSNLCAHFSSVYHKRSHNSRPPLMVSKLKYPSQHDVSMQRTKYVMNWVNPMACK